MESNKNSAVEKSKKSHKHNLKDPRVNRPLLTNKSPFDASEKVPYFFKEKFINESNAFTKYYEAIKKNGYISKIIKEVENMGNFCDLFCHISKDCKAYNMVCDDPIVDDNYYSAVPYFNDDILYASEKLKLIDTPNKGRCLVAREDIPKNFVLIHEWPTVQQVNPLCSCVGEEGTSLYRCHNCALTCDIFYTCDGCNICIFCSRRCQHIAYKNYHRYECYGLQRHFWSMDETDYSYLSLRMMLYGNSKNFETDPVVGSGYGDCHNNYPFIYTLESNFDQMSLPKINDILYNSARNLIYLISKTSFFYQFKDKKCILHDLYLYIGGLLVKHYCQAITNNVIVKYPNLKAGYGLDIISGSGKAICPTIALLNHSCSPNAVILVYTNGIVVRSLRPIKKEEEITICYKEVEPTLTLFERELITQEIFYFVCDCTFCDYERNYIIAPYKCPSCVNGRVKQLAVMDQIEWGLCTSCEKYFSLEEIQEAIKSVQVCRNLYDKTQSIEHATRIAESYSSIYHRNSWHLLDIYRLLYNKHVISGEKPLEAVKYGLLAFNILEHHISRGHRSILISKIKFVEVILAIDSFLELKEVTENEYETFKVFLSELMKIREDLLVYLPEHRLYFHDEILKKVHQIFQYMHIQKDKEKKDKENEKKDKEKEEEEEEEE